MFEKDIEKIDNDIVKNRNRSNFQNLWVRYRYPIYNRLAINQKSNIIFYESFNIFVREKSPSEKKSLEVLAMAKTSSEVLDFGARQNLKNQNVTGFITPSHNITLRYEIAIYIWLDALIHVAV